MSEIKQCPCCGEEILATAKKCKHCGEWLEKNEPENHEIITCPICGEHIEKTATVCPYCHESVKDSSTQVTASPAVNVNMYQQPIASAPVKIPLPANIERKWNWGGFVLGWLWGVCNGVYWPLVTFAISWIPYVGAIGCLAISVVLGINGNKWAWKKKSWESVERFQKVQHDWAIAALVVGILIAIGIISTFVFLGASLSSDELSGYLNSL